MVCQPIGSYSQTVYLTKTLCQREAGGRPTLLPTVTLHFQNTAEIQLPQQPPCGVDAAQQPRGLSQLREVLASILGGPSRQQNVHRAARTSRHQRLLAHG